MRRLLALMLCAAPLGWAQSALELEVLTRTNQVRAEYGLKPLTWDGPAYQAAAEHAKDMLERGYFAHENPEGRDSGWRMRQAGVMDVTNGENLASFEGYPDPEIPRRSLTGWMNSPGHRANLLKPEFTHLGVGLVRKGRKVMVVQNFIGRPFDAQVGFAPAAAAERTVLVLTGSADDTLGVFVNNNLYARLEAPISARLELPPKAEVGYGLYDGRTWWSAKPGEGGLRLRADLERTPVPGRTVTLNLPTGQFNLSVGKDPRFWQNVSGPARLELTLPGTLEALWIGQRKGSNVNFAYRIPLREEAK